MTIKTDGIIMLYYPNGDIRLRIQDELLSNTPSLDELYVNVTEPLGKSSGNEVDVV